MNNVIRDSFKSMVQQLIGFALGGFAGWSKAHGMDFGAELSVVIGVAAGMLVNLGWAVISHLLKKWKINAALLLEPNATNAQLDAVVAAVPTLQQLQEAITIPVREQPGAPIAAPPSAL